MKDKLIQAERERDEARALAEERRDYARAQNAKLSVENDALRARLAKAEAVVDAATHRSYVFSIPEWERWRDSLRSAIRALDADTAAGTDSGGSGAATPEGGHAAPTGGPMPPPEPAGSSLEATRDLQAPATRAELVAAVRAAQAKCEAGSAFGGTTHRALGALADALEIPRT